ncbi:hypothetical protein NDU88_009646 [Pleurodeles waltl]|uniref:Uncharacterized protein n=1 Tax=Pleurodeles waltl TaxID=8319 RepID=A0AAV7RY64_PLEWA|nr:hypothetical protein NDU88_009646 [Pleurodeles waltl]
MNFRGATWRRRQRNCVLAVPPTRGAEGSAVEASVVKQPDTLRASRGSGEKMEGVKVTRAGRGKGEQTGSNKRLTTAVAKSAVENVLRGVKTKESDLSSGDHSLGGSEDSETSETEDKTSSNEPTVRQLRRQRKLVKARPCAQGSSGNPSSTGAGGSGKVGTVPQEGATAICYSWPCCEGNLLPGSGRWSLQFYPVPAIFRTTMDVVPEASADP